MNKFVLSAIALTTASGIAFAGSGSEEWLTLDREIETLSSTLAPLDNHGVTVSGFLRSSYQNSGDVIVLPSGNDLGGFNIDNTRLNVDGSVGDFSVHMSVDSNGPTTGNPASGPVVNSGGLFGTLNGGGVVLVDAHASWNINEQFQLTMGQFRAPFLATAQRDENGLLFLDRDTDSALWSFRDQGVMLNGNYDQFGWALAVQNGVDGAGDDLAFAAHVFFNAMGNGMSETEGAYGSGQGNSLNVSAGYYMDDDTVADATAINIAADFTSGPLYVQGQFFDYDAGFGDTSPFQGTVSWMFVPDQWEAAVRYEDRDTASSTTVLTIGVNYYLQGHDAKWQVNYATVDDDNFDGDIIGLGLTTSV